MKRVLSSFLILFVFMLCSVQVFAWVPKYCVYCEINTLNIPDDTVCLELLVQKKDLGEKFFVDDSGNTVFPSVKRESQIANFYDDGFVSYTFHCKDSGSESSFENKQDNIAVTRYGINQKQGGESLESYEHIRKFRNIRFAYLDKNGNILELTESVFVRYYIPFRGYLDTICIDGTSVTVSYENGPPGPLILFGLLLCFVCIATLLCVRFNKKPKYN